MKKLILICLSLFICLSCSGCSAELNEEEYLEATNLIQSTFVKDIKNDLSVLGLEDIDVEITNIYFQQNSDYEYEFRFETEFVSKTIDKYSNVEKNGTEAKEIFTILKNMCDKYQEYLLYSIPWTFQDHELNLVYDFVYYDFTVKGNEHTYTYDFHNSSYQELVIDDEVAYENRVNIYPNATRKPSNSKENQAYFEGYYDVLENFSFDAIRYDSDDYYHMGVDDALAEIEAYF